MAEIIDLVMGVYSHQITMFGYTFSMLNMYNWFFFVSLLFAVYWAMLR